MAHKDIELPPDTELVDAWLVTADFKVGAIDPDKAWAMALQDEAEGCPEPKVALITDSGTGIARIMNATPVVGTQEFALHTTAQRYQSYLGALANKHSLVECTMNVEQIYDAHLQGQGLEDFDVEENDFGMTADQIDAVLSAPEPPHLYVTESFRQYLH